MRAFAANTVQARRGSGATTQRGRHMERLPTAVVCYGSTPIPDPTSPMGGRANAFLGGAPATTLQRLRPSSRCLRRLDLACRDPHPAAKVIKRRKCLICKHPLSVWGFVWTFLDGRESLGRNILCRRRPWHSSARPLPEPWCRNCGGIS